MHAQKELRLSERIEMLSKTFKKDQELHIVRDLQDALDKIRAILKPLYKQKIRDFPDFKMLKHERLEVGYADFAAFLAKHAVKYMESMEVISDEENFDGNRMYSGSKASSRKVRL